MNDRGNLSQRVIKGGLWILSLRASNRMIGLVRTFILARLLVPDDFGLLGIALFATATLETLSVTGLDRALIQRSETPHKYWDTAWLVQGIRGTALFILLYLAAPWVALFFKRPDAVWIIRAIALAPAIRGFNNPGVIRYAKELQFQRVFVYEFGITLADLVVSIPAALITRSAWALVAGNLAGQTAGLVISWIVKPHSLRLAFDREAFKELFGFGRWAAGAQILHFILTQGPDAVVGRVLNAQALGLYQMGYRLSTLSASEITQVLSNVTFPAYAKIQAERERVKAAYLRVVKVTALLSLPVGALVIMLGPDFTRVILGPSWVPMTQTMQMLAIYGLIFSLRATTGPVFFALARPDIPVKIQAVKLALLAGTIYHLTKHWGITGTAWAIALNAVLVDPAAFFLVMREVEGRMSEFLAALIPSLIITAGLGLAAGVVLVLLDSPLVRLLLGLTAAGLAYGVIFLALERLGHLGVIAEIRSFIAPPDNER